MVIKTALGVAIGKCIEAIENPRAAGVHQKKRHASKSRVGADPARARLNEVFKETTRQ